MLSYFSLFRNYANFSGFMRRGRFWAAMFVHGLIVLAPLVPGVLYLAGRSGLLPEPLDLAQPQSLISRIYLPWVLPLWCFYNLLMFIPVWSAQVRRLHSLPRSGWWLLLGLIPVIGSFILLIWFFQKGDYEEYLHRLKRARGENNLLNASTDTIAAATRARGGGWFFVFLLLLGCGGFFLNRHIQQAGVRETVKTAWQLVQTIDLSRVNAILNFNKSPNRSGQPDSGLILLTTGPETGSKPETGIVLLSPSAPAAQPESPTEAPTAITPEQEGRVSSGILFPTAPPTAESSGSPEAVQEVTEETNPTGPEETPEAEADRFFTREKDHGRMVFIPGGIFSMGAANGAIDERPVHEVTLSGFFMDLYEVTNEQYEFCVNDGVCTKPHETKSLRHTNYFGNPLYNHYPVIAVDRDQAVTFCEWVGGRLPTEAEWEYAAKGPEGNAYPWGPSFIAANLNYNGNGDYDTLAVNDMPEDVSFFGVYNLGGNVSEWVQDRYQENWYALTNQPIDPTGPTAGGYYVIRGGSAQTGQNNARTADRFFALAATYSLDRGFRCVLPKN